MSNFLLKTAIAILWIILLILFLAAMIILIGWLAIGSEYTFSNKTILGVNLASLYGWVGKYIKDFEPWHVFLTTLVSGVGTIISLLQAKNAITQINVSTTNSPNSFNVGAMTADTININTPNRDDARNLRNQDALRAAVRVFWVDGVLKNSLYNELLIRLNLDQQPDAVSRPWNLIQQQPNQPDRTIAKDKSIHDIFNAMGRQMLVLGAPGSGKTITLLTLAEALLLECAEDPTLPTPVVFNLSSWAEKQPPLDEWLVEELNQRYHMPKKVAQNWVENDELLLLLDGLDEVAAKKRDDCATAINAFRQEHVVDMAVCSRVEEYEDLTERLNLNGAITIRPLTNQQIDDYIVSAEPHLFSLKHALDNSADLRELAQTPLMLSVMTLTYHDQYVENDMNCSTDRNEGEQLFDSYIRRMFQHRELPHSYMSERTLKWLNWLSRQMVAHSQSVFYIERLQSSWLEQRQFPAGYLWIARMIVGFAIGLIVAISVGFVLGAIVWIFFGLEQGVIVALFVGGGVGLLLSLSSGSDFEILYDEEFDFSLRNGIFGGLLLASALGIFSTQLGRWFYNSQGGAHLGIVGGTVGIMIGGLVGGLSELKSINKKGVNWKKIIYTGLLFGTVTWVIVGLISGVTIGLIVGIFREVFGTVRSKKARLKELPNQGVHQLFKNSVIVLLSIGLVIGLISGFLAKQIVESIFGLTVGIVARILLGLVTGIVVGIYSALIVGLGSSIAHVRIRILLYFANHIPWNYARFLDYATERLFLRKVGGGYIFVHRMVMEHIAALTDEDIERITDGVGE